MCTFVVKLDKLLNVFASSCDQWEQSHNQNLNHYLLQSLGAGCKIPMLANICMYMVPHSNQGLGTGATGAYKLFHAWLQNIFNELSKHTLHGNGFCYLQTYLMLPGGHFFVAYR